jgi:hypothetical protein
MKNHKRMTERTQHGGVRYKRNGCVITVFPQSKNLTDMDKMALQLCEFEDRIEDGRLIQRSEYEQPN